MFAAVTCQPCTNGVACKAGVSQPCKAGSFNQILGAATCTACPAGQSSDAGEWLNIHLGVLVSQSGLEFRLLSEQMAHQI